MTITETRADKSQVLANRWFLPMLGLQVVLGGMVVFGLFYHGFWKTAVWEILKFWIVVPQAFQFRRASLEPNAPKVTASLLATAGSTLLAVSVFADVILIFYDVELGRYH